MNEQRKKEAEQNIKMYLAEGLLKKTTEATASKILEKNAQESIRAAKILLENDIPLWTIVAAYYSMFYKANAILLALGYKTGEKIAHKVTADALIAIVRPKLKDKFLEDYEELREEALRIAEIRADEIIDSFDYERRKRSFIQYQTPKEDIRAKANTSLKRAQEFLFETERLP